MLGSAESQVPKLITREIIFAEIPTRVITVHKRHRRTDGRTDNLSWQYRVYLVGLTIFHECILTSGHRLH